MTIIKNILFQDKTIRTSELNLIIGPNDSGKTTLLNEIAGYNPQSSNLFNFNLEFVEDINEDIFESKVKSMYLEFEKLNLSDSDYSKIQTFDSSNISGISLLFSINNGQKFHEFKKIKNKILPVNSIYKYFVSNLDCQSRLQNLNFQVTINDSASQLQSILHYFVVNQSKFKKIIQNIKLVFGKDILIDNIGVGLKTIWIKYNNIKMPNTNLDIQVKSDWYDTNCKRYYESGTGIQAYLNIIFALYDPYKKVIFIDEPESFLHPPQIRALANFILNNFNDKQIFVATHSSDFIKIFSEQKQISVTNIHVDKSEISQNRVINEIILDSKKSNQLNEKFLESFVNKLTFLFEDESDRFLIENYLRINNKSVNKIKHYDINFIGLNGKDKAIQTYQKLVSYGVKTIMILDFDSLHSSFCLDNLNSSDKIKIKNTSKVLKDKYSEKSNYRNLLKRVKQFGMTEILEEDRLIITDTISILRKYGIIIVSTGEIESLLELNKNNEKLSNNFDKILPSLKKFKFKKNIQKLFEESLF